LFLPVTYQRFVGSRQFTDASLDPDDVTSKHFNE